MQGRKDRSPGEIYDREDDSSKNFLCSAATATGSNEDMTREVRGLAAFGKTSSRPTVRLPAIAVARTVLAENIPRGDVLVDQEQPDGTTKTTRIPSPPSIAEFARNKKIDEKNEENIAATYASMTFNPRQAAIQALFEAGYTAGVLKQMFRLHVLDEEFVLNHNNRGATFESKSDIVSLADARYMAQQVAGRMFAAILKAQLSLVTSLRLATEIEEVPRERTGENEGNKTKGKPTWSTLFHSDESVTTDC
ncbi:unnamed protein product [Amoebophrya sp. A25]|nr:unnamed protein product [Amoebophrya sp. A25]|eukprot:GSA25T00008271001.1